MNETDYRLSLYEEIIINLRLIEDHLAYNRDGTTIGDRMRTVDSISTAFTSLSDAIDDGEVDRIHIQVDTIIKTSLKLVADSRTVLQFSGDDRTAFVEQDNPRFDLDYVDVLLSDMRRHVACVREWVRQGQRRQLVLSVTSLLQGCYMISEVYDFDIMDQYDF